MIAGTRVLVVVMDEIGFGSGTGCYIEFMSTLYGLCYVSRLLDLKDAWVAKV